MTCRGRLTGVATSDPMWPRRSAFGTKPGRVSSHQAEGIVELGYQQTTRPTEVDVPLPVHHA